MRLINKKSEALLDGARSITGLTKVFYALCLLIIVAHGLKVWGKVL